MERDQSRFGLEHKEKRLLSMLAEMQETVIAFSGGIDSAYLLKMCLLAGQEKTIACLAVSPSLPQQDWLDAVSLCKEWKVPLWQVNAGEFSREAYLQNDAQRCYHCKNALFETLSKMQSLGLPSTLLFGANFSDTGDFRPGMQAAREHEVRAPLLEAELSKEEIRILAKKVGVPIWDKPASPCLSSRIPYGERVVESKLENVERAESALRDMGFRTVRVRYYPEDRAKIEIADSDIQRIADIKVRTEIVHRFKKIGFQEVLLDLESFCSGKLNVFLG